jgi:hypothetical protein
LGGNPRIAKADAFCGGGFALAVTTDREERA